jgi:hypothetical protein
VAEHVTPGSFLEFLVFFAHFVLTRAHPRRTFRWVTPPQIALDQARLTQSSLEKEFITYWYEYPIKPWARISHSSHLRRPTSSSVNLRLGTFLLEHIPCVQCWHMCPLRATWLCTWFAHVCVTAGVGSIPNVTPRGWACQLSRISRLAPQTNTSLFLYTLSSLVRIREGLPGRSPIPNLLWAKHA